MADVKKLISVIKKREQLVDSAPAEFLAAMDRAQGILLERILEYIKKLDTASGVIENIPANVQLAVKMREEILDWFKDAGYYVAVNDLGKKYQKLFEVGGEYYKAMDVSPVFSARDLSALSEVKKSDLAFLSKNDERVLNMTYNQLLSSVHSQGSFRDLVSSYERLYLDSSAGDKIKFGILKRFGATYAQTNFAAFDRLIQQQKISELEIEKFLYSGSLIKDSRQFCVDRAGKIFTKEQVLSWQNLSWKGKIPDCPIFTCLGGYNCQHILSPTALNDDDLKQLEELYDSV